MSTAQESYKYQFIVVRTRVWTRACIINITQAIYNRLISDYDFLNEIWDGNKLPEDLSNEFSDFFKLSKRGYFLNDFDDSMKNHMYDSPLPPLTALNPIEKMPVKKDQR